MRPPEGGNPNSDIALVRYTYDVAGNRLSKIRNYFSTSTTDYTYYLRDASGNVLSIYERSEVVGQSGGGIDQKEVPLYGSSRIGLQKFSERQILFPGSSASYNEHR